MIHFKPQDMQSDVEAINICPKGPRTKIMGLEGPNTINILVFGP